MFGRNFSFILMIGFISFGLLYSDSVQELVDKREYKSAISYLRSHLSSDSVIRQNQLVEIAKIYLKDQEIEKGLETFLEALSIKISHPLKKVSSEEKGYFDEIYGFYLDQGYSDARTVSKQILEKYESIIKEHPEYTMLSFFIANSYANFGNYLEFVNEFFKAYKDHSDHYLVERTQGVIHIKLLDYSRTEEERDQHRQQAFRHFQAALKKAPKDITLYRLSLALCPKNEKSFFIHESFDQVISHNIPLARNDIYPFIIEAVAFKCYEDAQKLVEKAKEWYPYSRAVVKAENYLAYSLARQNN